MTPPHHTLLLTLLRCLPCQPQETQLALEKAIKAVSDPSTPATAAATMAPIARASLSSSLSSMDGADSVKGAAADAQVRQGSFGGVICSCWGSFCLPTVLGGWGGLNEGCCGRSSGAAGQFWWSDLLMLG